MPIKQTYHLHQQTPLIHFQHDEPGACLRASEVKPKLDKFLLERLGGEGKIPREWWISYDEKKEKPNHLALDYKMRFAAKGEPEIAEPHKLYFGNMGLKDRADFRKTVFYPDGVDMFIVCLHPDLMDKIHEWLPCFFALNAFGTRSGKGFGGFSLADREPDEAMLRDCCPHKIFYQIKYSSKQGHAALFNDIWVLSGMMKSGFNFTFRNASDYYKGRVFRYFSQKGIGGDKAFIKQRVLRGQDWNPSSEERARYQEYRFVRAMLGLPGGFEFRSGPKTTRRGNVTVDSNTIKRFSSPVQYRVQGNQLLIIPQKIPDELYDAAFQLNNQTIRTPRTFDLIDFLDAFIKDFNTRIDISAFRHPDILKSVVSTRLAIQKIGGGTQ